MADIDKATRVSVHASGVEFSSVVWGSMRSESQFSSDGELADHLHWLLDQGITTLDTAPPYGEPHPYTVEEFLGRAINAVGRDKFEIVTKCGIQRISPHRTENWIRHFDFSAKEIYRSVDRSLRKLGIEQIDVLLLHRPDYLMDPVETAGALDEVVAQGKVKHVGVSNFTPSRIALLESQLKAPLVTNQIEFSPMHVDPISDGTFDLAIRAAHRPMIWSPVGGGNLLTSDSEAAVSMRACLAKIAEKYDLATAADAAIAYVARHPAGGIPITGSGKRDRISGAIRATNTVLDRQDWYSVLTEINPSLFL